MEEGGGGEDNLRRRLEFEPVMDCARAHQILGVTQWHTGKRNLQRTWRSMAYIMRGLGGQTTDRESLRNYQAEQLGSSSGDTLLIELMPLRKPQIASWEYSELMPRFPAADEYYRSVKPQRIDLLHRELAKYNPKVVVCHGKAYWGDYRQIFMVSPSLHLEGLRSHGRDPL